MKFSFSIRLNRSEDLFRLLLHGYQRKIRGYMSRNLSTRRTFSCFMYTLTILRGESYQEGEFNVVAIIPILSVIYNSGTCQYDYADRILHTSHAARCPKPNKSKLINTQII